MLVAILGDWNTGHVLHGEERPTIVGDPRAVYLRDVRMIHQRERLSLGLEAGNHLASVHPHLDDLQGHSSSEGPLLLRQVDDPHPALAERVEDLVGADLSGSIEGSRGCSPRRARAGRRSWPRSYATPIRCRPRRIAERQSDRPEAPTRQKEGCDRSWSSLVRVKRDQFRTDLPELPLARVQAVPCSAVGVGRSLRQNGEGAYRTHSARSVLGGHVGHGASLLHDQVLTLR